MTIPDLTRCKQDPTLLDRMVIETDHGQLMAMFGLGAELYVVPREISKLRGDMIQVQADYFRRFGAQLDRMLIDSPKGDSRIEKLRGGPSLSFDHVGNEWPHDQAFTSVVFKHYTHPDYPAYAGTVSPYVSDFLVQAANDSKKRLSFYECYLPIADPQGTPYFNELINCVIQWASILQPAHGSAGYCVIYELATETAQRYAYPVLQRYPGLDIHSPVPFVWDGEALYEQIKCVNWLTVLGAPVLAKLGGLDVARKALEPDCIVHAYEGGVVIQAGSAPQLGDTYQNDIPEAYRKVARFTNSARFRDYKKGSLFRVFEPMDRREEARRWASRFD